MPDKTPPSIAYASLPEGWAETVREIVDRCGNAVRGRDNVPVIEIKSLTTNAWHPLGLPGGGTTFVSIQDRNIVLQIIQKKMNAVILREAKPPEKYEFGRTVILQIDGMQWESRVPENAGEAQTYNQDAQRIVEKLGRK